MAANYRATENSGDVEAETPKDAPKQWQLFDALEGRGVFEFQGFSAWTAQERAQWASGDLRCKWGIGQVTIRLPVSSATDGVAIAYGFLPFIIPLWWAVDVIWSFSLTGSCHVFPLFGLCLSATLALVNEALIKQACKSLLDKFSIQRPAESVCKQAGMPSGHALNAFTLMFWTLLEVLTDRIFYPEWVLVILFVLGPVPWARVYNGDHTWLQVRASVCVAFFTGIFAFCIRRAYFPNITEPWDYTNLNGGVASPFL